MRSILSLVPPSAIYSPPLPEVLKVLADSAADALMIIDVATRHYVYFNDAAVRMLRPLTRERITELGANGVGAYFGYASDRGSVYDALVARAPHQDSKEVKLVEPGGDSQRTIRFARHALEVAGRWMVVVNGRELTDDVHQRERIERLLSGLDVSDDGIFLIDRATMRYLDVNEGACRLLGYSREELMQRTANQTSRSLGSIDSLGKLYDEAIANAPATQVSEVVIDRADGTTIVCEARRKPVLQSGRWIIAATLRDITAAKRAQARMERFATALDLSGDAVFMVDRASLEYVDVNAAACALLGYSRDELLRRKPYEAPLLKFNKDELSALYDRVIAQAPATLTQEVGLVRRDGSVVTCDVRRQALRSESGWLIVAICRDVTERKAAHARAQLLATVVNSNADRVYFIDRERMEFMEANDAALRRHGVATIDELRRMKPWDGLRRPTTRAELEASYDEVIAQAPVSYRAMDVWHHANGDVAGAAEITRTAMRIDGRWVIVATWHDMSEHVRQRARMDRFAIALDLSSDAISFIDRATMTFVDVNEAGCALIGLTREEMLQSRPGQAGWVSMPVEELTALYDDLIARSPATDSRESEYRMPDGRLIHVDVRRQAIRSDGRWLICVNTRDISERKATQMRNELLATAMNFSSDHMVIVDPETVRVIDANEATLKFHGLQREEAQALPVWLPRPDFTREQMAAEFRRAIEKWPDFDHSVYRGRGIKTGKTGVFDVRRQALKIAGRWVVLGTSTDVTERQEHLARIERLAAAIELGDDGIVLIDGECDEVLYANESMARLLGTSREDLMRSSGAALAKVGPAFADVIRQSPATLSAEVTVRHSAGRDIPCEVRRQAIRSHDRWIVVSTLRDISERQRAEEDIRQKVEELTRSNQELEQFAYVTSHDLSEPLRMVASYTQLLERRYAANFDHDAREFMGYIVGGAQRMKQLIDDLLAYSRAGRANVPMRAVVLDRALDDALANLGHAIRTSRATIERDPLPTISGDRSSMVQVFQNLIGNAIKFHAENVAPSVRVTLRDTGIDWEVCVADNGIGIEPEYFDRIFVIFQRLHPRQKYEGTGIGLAICKKVIDRHRGQIAVESQPGRGTTFRIRLPKSAPPNMEAKE
jgi:PAS domain S-box-containing protein